VLVVDQRVLFREALAESLRARGYSVHQTGDIAEARRYYRISDILLSACDFHNPHALQIVAEFAQANPSGRAVTLTQTLSAEAFVNTIHAGGAGSIERSCSLEELVSVLHRLMRRESIRDPEEVVQILTQATQESHRRRKVESALSLLTHREGEILRCIAAGLTGPEIAGRLSISEKTVRAQVASILRKLGVHSKLQAVIFAAATGYVELRLPEAAIHALRQPLQMNAQTDDLPS
jgi:DNA-binding NarL/FixJ family response regulator